MNPTNQALKAADAVINSDAAWRGHSVHHLRQAECARIIDRETSLPTLTAQAAMAAELAEQLEFLRNQLAKYRNLQVTTELHCDNSKDTLTRWQAMQKEGKPQ